MSIIIPIDYHADELPLPDLQEAWLAQIPPEIAEAHPARLALIEDWRAAPAKQVDEEILRGLAPKEMRRARFSGAGPEPILETVARFWSAAETYLDRGIPDAIALWNCGNADQNVWAMLAGERHIPIMHCEHGWLPQTRIFDPMGAYVTGRSGLDAISDQPASEGMGDSIIQLWRAARLSKHAQGGEPSEAVQEFAARGPALLVAMQLEADGAVVYNEIEFDCQRSFLRRCLSWPGPVLVKKHPAADGLEWEPDFIEHRRLCRMEVEARGGMWLDGNESIHELLPIVHAAAAINSNVLFEAAMARRPALSFGKGPHSGRGFTVDMGVGAEWPTGDQTPAQWAAVCEHVARMEAYLTPEGAWLPTWDHLAFWGAPFWGQAKAALLLRWELLLAEAQA